MKKRSVINAMSYNIWDGGRPDVVYAAQNNSESIVNIEVEVRAPKMVALLNGEDIDVAGLQEVAANTKWVRWLRDNLDEKYGMVAAHTFDIRSGVYIIYRKERLEVLDNGIFWLAEGAPATPAKLADGDFQRICNWALFRVKATGEAFVFMDTHLAAGLCMLRNKMVKDYAKRLSPDVYEKDLLAYLWSYIDDYSPDAPCQNIEISGGVWNCNNQNQLPNPERKIDLSVREFYGCGMLFYNVKNFKISSLTVKDPSQYGMTLDTVSYFTVENITFDYNLGNPYPTNMDGIHLDGNCHYGTIRNLKGSCYDDMVALNAHEGSSGPITNIEINGLYSEYCHSAVRLLLVSEVIENIHISNVFGRFYQYCVGLTKYYPGETTGRYDAISLDNIYASKDMPVRKGEYQHPRKIEDSCHLIWVQEDMVVNNLTVRSLHRRERILPKDTIHIGEQAVVDRLILDDITTENYTGEPMILLNNCGTIRYLSMRNIDSGNDRTLVNSGIIENCVD